ncbi:hypothetical protein Tco_1319418, partial [Tanacetum coccineum]
MKTTMPTSVPALEIDLVAENPTSASILQQKDALKNAYKVVEKADVQNAPVQKSVVQKAAIQKANVQKADIQALTVPQKAARTAAQKVSTQEAKKVLENKLIDVGDTIGVRGPLSNAAYLRWMSRDDYTSGYVVDVSASMFVGQEESFSITVDASDILDMWTNGKFDASILTYFNGHLRGVHIHYYPGVLGGDTYEGYIFITARVFLEGTPMRGELDAWIILCALESKFDKISFMDYINFEINFQTTHLEVVLLYLVLLYYEVTPLDIFPLRHIFGGVTFLKKPEESVGFAEIVDFLKGSHI